MILISFISYGHKRKVPTLYPKKKERKVPTLKELNDFNLILLSLGSWEDEITMPEYLMSCLPCPCPYPFVLLLALEIPLSRIKDNKYLRIERRKKEWFVPFL